jgi:hypothetical protein
VAVELEEGLFSLEEDLFEEFEAETVEHDAKAAKAKGRTKNERLFILNQTSR